MEKEEINEYIEEIMGLRICDKCNFAMNKGFCNIEGYIHICDSCFNSYMDNIYGSKLWRQTADDGCGGFYEYYENGKWNGTGIFWTEWELYSTDKQKEIYNNCFNE